MFDWENFRHFLEVARTGTLSGAARALQVDHATVSRRLAALEQELQVSLIERLPRSCRLTTVGIEIYEHALNIEASAFNVELISRATQGPLSQKVKLSAPPVLVTHLLAYQVANFRAQHSDILLSVSAQAHQVSLSRREADLAIRLLRPSESSNIVRKLGDMHFALYASKDYAELKNPDNWSFIAYDDQYADFPQQQWLLTVAGNRPVGCELSDINSHLIAAKAGAGVAGLPCFVGDKDSQLVRLDYDGEKFSRDIWLVLHKDLRRSASVRTVINFLDKTIVGAPGLH